MTDEKKKTVIRVGGREYTLISAEPVEYLRRVEHYVDRRLTETALATHQPQPVAAVLTCISMGDDLLKAQDENTRLRRELRALHAQLDAMKPEE